MLTAAAMGATLAWAGCLAYLLASQAGLALGWTTPWLWAARPPHDTGAAVCAVLVLTAGLTVIALHGARDPAGE